MDHADAHLIEYTDAPAGSKEIVSKFTHQEKEHSIGESVELMHNIEQHKEQQYYKKIGEMIRHYDNVLLFGPTEAKTELYNYLKANHYFDKIKINVMPTDKMNEQQQYAFIKNYFQHTDMAF